MISVNKRDKIFAATSFCFSFCFR